MAGVISFLFSNFTLTLFVVGLIASLIALIMHKSRADLSRSEAFLRWFLFFSIGVSFFYNFVMHVFFGAMAARFIGWADSPFQAEVGFASLGFSVLGFLAFRGSRDMRLAAILGPALFLWGAAAGHLYQMVTARNFAPGNAGIIFYTDILIPFIGLAFWRWRYRAERDS